MDKIVFFHMNQLGDLLFSLPVLEAARKQWPDKKIISVIRPDLAPILKATGFVDEIIIKENKSVAHFFKLVSILSRKNIAKAVLFSESPESLLLVLLSRIPERIGFKGALLDFILTKKTKRLGVPSLENNANLGINAGLVGISKDYSGLVKIPQEEKTRLESWIIQNGLDKKKIVIISTGTSKRRKEKSWQKEKWVKLISLIIENNCFPVLAGSPKEKNELQIIAEKFGEKVVTFTDFGIIGLGALMLKAGFFIGVDSGAMHLAASLRVPVVALFGPTDPSQIGPQPLESNIIIQKNDMPEIEVEEVWDRIKGKL